MDRGAAPGARRGRNDRHLHISAPTSTPVAARPERRTRLIAPESSPSRRNQGESGRASLVVRKILHPPMAFILASQTLALLRLKNHPSATPVRTALPPPPNAPQIDPLAA